ncbi:MULTISPECIES: glutamate synthase [Acidianus]|uniref:Glutamate synthase n=1 Tax=Candidatus Acidianus copahuensis TaxID=1160895 RepID=A0A031LPM4_9CREN|nr:MULTISPECIES: glutamate synthase [Acidianus]EZQ06946.1 glutamate synthase [Candidatus Acidianus copahuensis]NON62166.1 glutamate synthase [Acidianus sp. RZ1]
MISPSGCGVFGVLRKRNSGKIKGKLVVNAIDSVRYRGSDKGAGFAVFNLNRRNEYLVKAFYSGNSQELEEELRRQGLRIEDKSLKEIGEVCDCNFQITISSVASLRKAVRNLNEIMWKDMEGRVYSVGRSLQVYKGVGYPSDIASLYNVNEMDGDMWLAHTRQPTNSPGHYPYWSHPFSSFDIAIVHNGDVSSFGANVEFLRSRGWEGFVGTDSEVMAFLFEELINDGLSVEEAVKMLLNPPRRQRILSSHEDYLYRNARLDGPFTAVIGYDSGDDLYLIGIADRSKFRPAIIGEDENNFYIASEETQIRLFNPKAKVWTLTPGGYFIASLNRGVISLGRDPEIVKNYSIPIFIPSNYDIDASNVGYKDLNKEILNFAKIKRDITIANVMGHRFIGINFPREGLTLRLYGIVGNAMANLNEKNIFQVYGNVADDCCDTMQGGKVVIHGDARDVIGQAMQGGKVFVKGNSGNRVGIQMREYQDRRPYLVIGGVTDDYLGEYMAGGVILVLGKGVRREPVGNFVGTGMVGGRIYIRGKVDPLKIGLQPNKYELTRFLKALVMEELITQEEYLEYIDRPYVEIMKRLQGEAKKYARRMFEEKIGIPDYEYRELNEGEIKELMPIVEEFEADIGGKYSDLLSEKFTIISSSKK